MNTVKKFKPVQYAVRMFNDMPLIPKLAISYIFSIVLCVAIVSVFYFVQIKNEIETRSAELAENIVKQSKVAIDNKIMSYNKLMDFMYLSRSFQDLLFFEYYDTVEAKLKADEILESLNPFSETVKEYVNITLYLSNRTIPQKDAIRKLEEIEHQPWYMAMNHNIDKIIWQTSPEPSPAPPGACAGICGTRAGGR